jgi:hypothetical protein
MDLNFGHYLLHPFKEVWNNMKLQIKAHKHYSNFYKGDTKNREVKVPEGYNLVFEDGFTGPLNMQEWRYAMPWGDFHPGSLHQYYDNDGTLSYVAPEGLILELRKIPKTFKKADLPDWRQGDLPEEFTIPVGVGHVSTKKAWHYGWFEAWIQLPKGQSYWPAFWLSGIKTWPPEIDIFEGYSHIGPNYESYTLINRFLKKPNRRIRPNLHYGKTEDGTKTDYKSYDIPVAEATERLVHYACHWEHDFIKIYFDGILIMEVTNQEVLRWFNKEDAQQYVIINHGLHMGYPDNPDESAMIVRSFKVYQK